ncbi:ATP-binding cassette domain-containing protein [Candidatus Woesearchaeota archaeon]|nr:ATP-binding cassette domain-containing protein [Candidatus Woesearchaeota archaeon]
MMTIIDGKSEVEGSQVMPKDWKRMVFDRVSFRYRDKWVLKNFSLVIMRNDRIGIVGKSGSGKSTVAKLLLGLYTPTRGRILVDGIDLNAFTRHSRVRQIGAVLQDAEVFNDTLARNIAVGMAVNTDRVNAAIRDSGLQSVVNRLPRGHKTVIGEKGYCFSGGERQRLGIARALYRDVPCIIFDEATSSLDTATERDVQRAVDALQKTVLIIAHRLSTLKNMDRIVVMQKGRIVEDGTFEQLTQRRGIFAQLHAQARA